MRMKKARATDLPAHPCSKSTDLLLPLMILCAVFDVIKGLITFYLVSMSSVPSVAIVLLFHKMRRQEKGDLGEQE